MSQTKKALAKFAVGDAVRVRVGVNDPDFPDIPLGGWAGKINEVEESEPPLYLIRWSRETLRDMRPVYRNRCERDGLDHEEMRLGEDELEADVGGPVVLEQPTKIVTPPLSMKDQDDRVRAVFGLTRDDVLPEADEDSLRIYYKYLAPKLKFPVEATWAQEAGLGEVNEKVSILALGGGDDDPWIDDLHGIICEAKMSRGEGKLPLAEMERVKGKPNKQLIEDYAYWFWNNR